MKLIYWLPCSDVIWLPLLLVRAGLFWKRLIIFKNQRLMILPWRLTLLILLASLRGCVHLGVCVCVCVCIPTCWALLHSCRPELEKAWGSGCGRQGAHGGRQRCLEKCTSAVYAVVITGVIRQLRVWLRRCSQSQSPGFELWLCHIPHV